MLAGVVAHEISHVVARHSIKQIQQQQEINVIGSILLGQNPNALAQIAAQVIAGGAMARFSRADEKQADDMGLHFLVKAGYDPHGMLDMFQKLLALDRSAAGPPSHGSSRTTPARRIASTTLPDASAKWGRPEGPSTIRSIRSFGAASGSDRFIHWRGGHELGVAAPSFRFFLRQ